MTDRIVDIAESAVYLSVSLDNLIIKQNKEEISRVHLPDLAALIVSHSQVNYTQAVLAGIAEHGGIFISCDRKHLPTAMMLPLQGHHAQTVKFAKQNELKKPTCKKLWQQLAKAKIRAQGRLLRELHGSDFGLLDMAKQVRSGDVGNVEAMAARRYWQHVFTDPFKRDFNASNHNQHLNYGYAVLRGIIARAVCGAGLHPAIGLQHHNRYNPFCLADDLIEPFRPVVDAAVYELIVSGQDTVGLSSNAKKIIIETLQDRYSWRGEERTLFDWSAKMAQSLAQIVDTGGGQLVIPEL